MQRNKRFFALACTLAAALIFFVAAPVSASETLPPQSPREIAELLPGDVFDAVSVIPEKPHFLQGFAQKEDPFRVFQESRRFFRTHRMDGGGRPLVDKQGSEYARPTGETALRDSLTIGGHEVVVLYGDYYRRSDNGMYTLWSSSLGEVNLATFSPLYRKYEIQWGMEKLSDAEWDAVKQQLGRQQFYAVRSFVRSQIRKGIAKNVRDYGEIINLTERVAENRTRMLDDTAYPERLNEPIPGAPGVTVGDMLPLPRVRPQDFAPDTIVVTGSLSVGGFNNAVKVGDSESIVGLSMIGLAVDWISSSASLTAHEFVHSNSSLQGLPLVFYYDVEMWAELTTGIHRRGDVFNFLLHPYLPVVREMVRVQWGYDAEAAMNQIMPPGMSIALADIDEEAYRRHVQEVARIGEELQRFIMDPEDGIMVHFYTDPYFWTGVNTKFCDTAAIYRLLFTLNYDSAGIYDPEELGPDGDPVPPEVQTKRWLDREMEAGRIGQLADQAMLGAGTESEDAEEIAREVEETIDISNAGDLTACPVHSRSFQMTQEERDAFVGAVKELAQQAKNGSPLAMSLLRRAFQGSNSLSTIQQAAHF